MKDGLESECSIVGVRLQDWSGKHLQQTPTEINISCVWWKWESDKALNPDWNTVVRDLHDNHGVYTLSYINPFLANVSSKPASFRRDLFAEAGKAQCTVQNLATNITLIVSSGPGIDAGTFDFDEPVSTELAC